jgi:hypothetical protein
LEAAEAGAVIPDQGTELVQPRDPFALPILIIQRGQGALSIPLSLDGKKEKKSEN